MKYEWEAEIDVDLGVDMVEAIRPHDFADRFEIVGVAIANTETGEAAYFSTIKNDGSVYVADIMHDVAADADDFYRQTIQEMERSFIEAKFRGKIH